MIKKIFFVLFFFQLSIAASANADAIVSRHNNQALNANGISQFHDEFVKSIHQQEFNDDSSESNNNQKKNTNIYVRFVHSRSNNSVAVLPVQQVITSNVATLLKHDQTLSIVRDAILPAYYSFLFRLSPF